MPYASCFKKVIWKHPGIMGYGIGIGVGVCIFVLNHKSLSLLLKKILGRVKYAKVLRHGFQWFQPVRDQIFTKWLMMLGSQT